MARPRKDPSATKSAQVSLRLPATLRARLEAVCREAERSLNQEIEIRLRRSFEQNENIKKQFGETNFWLFAITARLIGYLERGTGERWWDDAYTFLQVKALMNTLLDHFKPTGRGGAPKRFRGMRPGLGEQMAIKELASLETAMRQSHLLDGLPRESDGTLRRNPDGTYPAAGTLTSPWPHAGEWFDAAGPLVPKMKKSALPAFLRQLEQKS
jgi:hypothetical protein